MGSNFGMCIYVMSLYMYEYKKYYRVGGLNNRNLFSHSLEAGVLDGVASTVGLW